jgi:hypothetical protein
MVGSSVLVKFWILSDREFGEKPSPGGWVAGGCIDGSRSDIRRF